MIREGQRSARTHGTRGAVLFVAPEPFYEDRGTPIAVREVLVALSELGFETDLLTFPLGESVELPGLKIFRVENPFGFQRVPIGFSSRKVLFDLAITVALRQRLRERHYVGIHAVEEAAFPAVFLAKRHRVPVLYDMQSCLPEQLAKSAFFRFPPVRAALDASQNWLIRKADAIACSAGLEERVRRVHPKANVAAWHYPAVHFDPVTPVGQLRRSLGIAEDRPVVVYTGNFESYQGVGRLVESIPHVISQVPNAAFVLVGANGTTRNPLPAMAGALEIRGSLITIPRQPRAAIGSYLELADVVVSPRESIGNLPLKVFDYMAAGKPIVATDNATHRSVLNDDRAWLVSPGPEAMGNAIATLLTDRERADTMGEHARTYARNHLGWLAFKSRLDALYRGVMRDPDDVG